MGTITHSKVSGQADNGSTNLVQPSDWNAGHVLNLTKSDVGLTNVDNTSDANKPVSTAQQTALNTVAAGNVATGGTTGQILAKTSATNYATNWITIPVQSLIAGTGITIDTSTNPNNPTISVTGAGSGDITQASFVAPPTTGWTWVNQGTSVLTTGANFLKIEGQAGSSGLQVRGLFRSLPALTNYTVTVCMTLNAFAKQFHTCGLALRNSSTGALIVLSLQSLRPATGTTDSPGVRSIQYYKASSPTAYVADYVAYGAPAYNKIWLRFVDDGTNRLAYVSADGLDWLLAYSVSRLDYTAPDQIGFMLNCENTLTPALSPIARLWSWQATTP